MAIEKVDPILAESEQVRKLKESYKYGWSDSTHYKETPKRGLSHEVIDMISDRKSEPEWMRKFRHKSLDRFLARPMPAWGADLSGIDFDSIYYYIKPMEQVKTWEEMPAEIKSTWDKLGIPEAEKNYLGGVSVQYECLRGSTLIPTSRGFRAIKELDSGDQVFSLDETAKEIVPSRVLGKKESGEKEIFEIRVRGRVVGASANHPFLVLRDERKPGRQRARFKARWVPVEELKVEDLVAVATDLPEFGQPFNLIKPSRPEAKDFPETTSDDLCWWLGVYLGDGYINHPDSYPSCAIAIDRTDESLVAEIRRVGQELFGLDFQIAKDGLRLRTKGTAALVEFLILNGFGGKSLTKRIPDWISSLPRSQRLSFLAGYLDSDGHVRSHPKNKDVVFNTANQALAEDLHELVILCGIGTSRVSTATQKHVYDKDRTMFTYQLHLSGRFDRIPARSRKAERLGKRRWYHKYNSARGTVYRSHVGEMFGFARVESITSVGVEATYDIEVENHHNFVAEGFIVHNSESVYHSTKKELEDKGVIFCDMDTALREYPDLVKEYWATVIPANDNKFSALNSAVWSGGSFIWVPEGVSVEVPLQAYFRINQENMGQFERTMIIVEPGAWVHYIEGCSAPVYSSDSLHSAVVEIIVKDHARARYTTVQNWSSNVYNLVTKRARAEEGAVMEWVDFNAGSKVTMKYPSVYLMGKGAKGEILSIAYAGQGQHQDAGGKVHHVAPYTESTIVSKSISKDGGRAGYRGLVRVQDGAVKSKSNVRCDALILDDESRSDTYPYMEIEEETASISHEATVSKIGDEQLFYLMSRGINEVEAASLIVRGFIEPITKELPLEYAVEMNRLIELQMEGSVG